jgi:hypothetical protein
VVLRLAVVEEEAVVLQITAVAVEVVVTAAEVDSKYNNDNTNEKSRKIYLSNRCSLFLFSISSSNYNDSNNNTNSKSNSGCSYIISNTYGRRFVISF